MSIFKMADISHLRLYVSNKKAQLSLYNFLQVINRHHSCKLLSF